MMCPDDLDEVFARVRRNMIGVSDEAAREIVKRWRRYADVLEARALSYDASRTPVQASLARGEALDWRRDAAGLEMQLR